MGNKMRTFNNQDECRSLKDSLQKAQAEIKKIDLTSGDHEKRLTELSLRADSIKDNLELTNGVVMRVHTEHEETRNKSLNNANKNHELDVAVRRCEDEHGHTVQSLQIVKEGLAKLMAEQTATRDKLGETCERVRELGSG